jgi:Toprim-like
MPVLPGADIRGFYAALGIHLPPQAEGNACVRCFASPDAHRREDRNPSMSVRLIDGVWKCHGCGARGGPYDAAWAQGHSKRSSMDLLVAYGLAERRPSRAAVRRTRRAGAARPTPARASAFAQPSGAIAVRAELRVDERDVARWRSTLTFCRGLLKRLERERAWRSEVIDSLELGLHRGRVTIPIRTRLGVLRGVLRYQSGGDPKMLAVEGTRLGLIPHPACEASGDVLLVEGPPDMIAARSAGLPAIAVPGTDAWRPEWAQLLAGRRVTVVMDADPPGRELAERIAADLANVAREILVVDLAPGRDDGYDLTDWLLEHRPRVTLERLRALA